MKQLLLIPFLCLLLLSCGEDEEPAAPAPAPPANTESSHTSEKIIENPMDSVLMAEFMELTKGTQSTDSLKLQLDKLTESNDSLMRIVLNMQDSLDHNFPIVFPKPEVDNTDYNKPPDGNTERHSYQLFGATIPEKAKSISAFPKDLIGSYVSSNNDQAKLKITSTDITYTNKSDTAIFIISSNRTYTYYNNTHILNFKQESGWAAVLLSLKGTNLSFKTVPKSANLKDPVSKKEFKKYLEEASGTVLSVFIKVK